MSELTPKAIFEEKIPEGIKKDPSKAKNVGAVYQFDITGQNGGTWTVDLKAEPPQVRSGTAEQPGCTITMVDNDFVDLVTGKLNGQMAFMSGKIKIKGNMGLAMKLNQVIGKV